MSGLIEADGSFQVRTSLQSKYPRLALSFELTQAPVLLSLNRESGYTAGSTSIGSTLPFMTAIGDFLNINVKLRRTERKFPEYRLRTCSVSNNLIVKNYLDLYPLYGTKYMDFKD